jgi:cell division protein FtsB
MKGIRNLDAALRFWQGRYDTLAAALDQLRRRHRSLGELRDHDRQLMTKRHELTVSGPVSLGRSLSALHSQLVAHAWHDERTAAQQRAVSEQIERTRNEMQILKAKLKQVEKMITRATRAEAVAVGRRLDAEAGYLHLIRNQEGWKIT